MSAATCPRCGADAPDDARFCQGCGAAMGDGEGDLVGKVVARKYKVLDSIGEGSMGRIYLAEHLGLEKRVALKVLHREVVLGPEGLQRFRREGVAAGKLSHPNAIEVFDFDVTEAGDAFLAMEFIEGRDLRKVLEDDGALDLEAARDVVLQALDALGAAHGHGIVHRDLKPENIMVTDGPSGPRVKVLDFGLSKLVDTRMEASLATIPGRVIGTPFYMAPEQSSGEEADPRTDLYAMGIIFYELLAGQRPFSGRNLTELLYAQATKDVPSINELPQVGGLPPWVDAFLERALGRDRDDRYQSAAAMADDLREGRATPSGAPRRPRPEPQRRDRHPAQAPARSVWIVPTILGAAAIAIVSTVLALKGDGAGEDGVPPGGVSAGKSNSARIRMKPAVSRTEAEATYLRLLENARSQILAGNPDAAEGTVNAVMSLPQADAEAFFVRGSMYLAKGDTDAAAADLRTACEMDATFSEARAEFGWVEFERQRPDEALALFEGALAQDGECADALAGRAAVLIERGGDDTEIVDLLDRAVAADRNSWRAQLGRAHRSLAGGDFESAIEGFVEAKRVNPRSLEAVIGLARAYLASDRAEDAILQFEAALAISTNERSAVRGLTAVYLDRGRFREAAELLQPIIDRGDAGATEHALLGLAKHGLDDLSGAMTELQAAVDAGIGDPRPKVLLASIHLGAGDADRALRAAELALKDDYDFADAHLYCGLALFRLERYEESEPVLRRAVALDDQCTTAWLVLGVLGMDYLLDGSRAVDDLRAYLEAGGDDPRAEQWLAELEGR